MKYGYDIFIICGSYGGHTTYDGRQTTSGVWHSLPTDELKSKIILYGSINKAGEAGQINPLLEYTRV